MIIYAATRKMLLDIPVKNILEFEEGLFSFMDTKHPNVGKEIRETKALSEDLEKELKNCINVYKETLSYKE